MSAIGNLPVGGMWKKLNASAPRTAEHSEGPVRRAGLEQLAAKPGEMVLEIGFGTGHSLVSLA